MTKTPTTAPGATPPSAASASESVFLGILHGLEAQRFVPGQRLVEVDLALQFGVGRNSVREALQRLAAEGIVELQRHRGATIRSLSLRETLDVLDVAERMTGLLARSAARAVAAGAPCRPLNESLQGLRLADRARDAQAFAQARRAFYRALLEASGSRELRRLFPSIQMPVVHVQQWVGSLQQLRLADYRAIGAAVAAGDEAGAERAGEDHVRHVRDAVLAAQAQGLAAA